MKFGFRAETKLLIFDFTTKPRCAELSGTERSFVERNREDPSCAEATNADPSEAKTIGADPSCAERGGAERSRFSFIFCFFSAFFRLFFTFIYFFQKKKFFCLCYQFNFSVCVYLCFFHSCFPYVHFFFFLSFFFFLFFVFFSFSFSSSSSLLSFLQEGNLGFYQGGPSHPFHPPLLPFNPPPPFTFDSLRLPGASPGGVSWGRLRGLNPPLTPPLINPPPSPQYRFGPTRRPRPEGWSPEGWGPKFGAFFPSPATKFVLFFPLWGPFVEFWWCLKRRGPARAVV